jgi:hypothetical protein
MGDSDLKSRQLVFQNAINPKRDKSRLYNGIGLRRMYLVIDTLTTFIKTIFIMFTCYKKHFLINKNIFWNV